MRYLKVLMILGGIVLGGYLMGLAFGTKLGSPEMNNVVFISGAILLIACGGYLIYRIFKRLIKGS